MACALGIVVALIAGVLEMTPKQDRAGFLNIVRDTIKQDLKDVARWLRID